MTSDSDASPLRFSRAGQPLLAVSALAGAPPDGTEEPVFSDISLDLARGEVVSLLGASGCGKSTLLRTLGGLQKARSGEILLQGERVEAARPEIGFVFQKAILFPWLSVRQNVAFGLTLHHGPRYGKADLNARIDAALDDVGLHDAAHLRPHQLSGGMAQRVSLARALAREPALLLLDEPLGALDAITRLEMQKLILDVAGRHRIAVLWVTHDIDEALLVSDRVFLMDRKPGRIVDQWQLFTPKPRFDSLDPLLPLRVSILAALSRVAGPVRSNSVQRKVA